MAETFFEEIVRYVRFDGADQARLQALFPIAQPHFVEISELFYERIKQHEAARLVFQGPEQVERLQVSLRAWMERLLLGPWDEGYYEASARIGRMHVKVKLPQRYMFTAMAVIRSQLAEIAVHDLPDGDQAPTLLALSRAIDLELAIMLETYRDDYMAAMQRFERLERDLLQRRLVVSEARYHALLDDPGLIALGVDAERKVMIFNPGAERLTEYTRAEMLGQDLLPALCHPNDADAIAGAIADAIADTSEGAAGSDGPVAARIGGVTVGRMRSPLEVRILNRRGLERWVRWHAAHWASTGGALVCLIGFDVTAERALAERTRRAEHLASLGTLAAGLAHEIRNPLNAAQLQLQLAERRIRRGGPHDQALTAMGVVRAELHRLAGLVGDFLAFARPAPMRLAGTDLRAVIAAVIELLTPDATAMGVALSIDAVHPVIARVDHERIVQVVHNLVRNGLEAAGRGGQVAIAARRGPTTAEIEVADTGGGLPSTIDIFEPFATTKDGGTGLGLSIVHRIITDHGGEIAVERRQDQTVFTISVPLDGPP